MSLTLASLRARVQTEIHDTDAKHGSLDTSQLDHIIANAYLALQSWLPPPQLNIPSAFTIAVGDTFALPTVANTNYVSLSQYAGDVRIRLTNRPMYGNLRKCTVEEIDRLRNVPSVTQQGWPHSYCLWEQNEQTVQGRCWPAASVAEPCDLFVSLVADDLRDAADMDLANVRFSRYGATALVYKASALAVASMDGEALKLRRLNPNIASEWNAMSERIAWKEAARRHNEASVGRVLRNVS